MSNNTVLLKVVLVLMTILFSRGTFAQDQNVEKARVLVSEIFAPEVVDPVEIEFEMTTGVNPESLSSILEKGILNRYQTGTSGARHFSDELRIKVESKLSGQNLNKEMGSLLPKYGLVRVYKKNLARLDAQRNWIGWYGPIHLVLDKKSLLDRTTFANSDSLLAAAYSHGEPVKFRDGRYFTGLLPLAKRGLLKQVLEQNQTSFIELQIWGPIEATDIKEVWTWLQPGESGYRQTQQFAKYLKIPFRPVPKNELGKSLFVPSTIEREKRAATCSNF